MISAFSISEFAIADVGQRIVPATVSMNANFTQTTTNIIRIRINSVHVISTFVTVKVASGTMTATVILDANFTQTTNTIRVRPNSNINFDANFTQTTTGTRIRLGTSSLDGRFIMTTVGAPVWERIRIVANENWTPITHTGDTWTPINAGGNIQSWTEVEPPNGIN